MLQQINRSWWYLLSIYDSTQYYGSQGGAIGGCRPQVAQGMDGKGGLERNRIPGALKEWKRKGLKGGKFKPEVLYKWPRLFNRDLAPFVPGAITRLAGSVVGQPTTIASDIQQHSQITVANTL